MNALTDEIEDDGESVTVEIHAIHTPGYNKSGSADFKIEDVPGANNGCDACSDTCYATPHPIHYSDGKILMSVTDLSMNRAGVTWNHQRFYDNTLSVRHDFGNGCRWKSPTLSKVMNAGFGKSESRVVEFSNTKAIYFKEQKDVYTPQFGTKQVMWKDTSTDRITNTNGDVWAFHNTTSGNNLAGTLESITSSGGGKVTIAYSASGQIGTARIIEGTGSTALIDEMVYTWNVTTKQISSILLRRSTNNGSSWTNLERVNYTYYTASENNGTLGDLKFVTNQLWNGTSWVDTGTYYYRYYKQGEANGFVSGLKYAFTPSDYSQLATAVSQPTSASDAVVAPFASKYYAYGAARRVTLEKVRGGKETYSLDYKEFMADYFNSNAVHARTIETKPNGSQRKVYTNYLGKILLSEEIPPAGSSDQSIVHYTVYDDNFQKIEDYSPASIASYSEKISGNSCKLTVNVNPTEGLVKLTSYYPATDSMPAGYVNEQKIKQGKNGTSTLVEKQEYVVQTQGNQNLVLPSKETRYAESGNLITQYAYTFFSGTLQIQQKTTTLPAVSAANNGNATANTVVERFDINGNLVWSKDEVGIISYNEYSTVHGRLVKSIQDVKTSTGGFVTSVPSGWATVSGAGKHLVSEYEYDALGRQTQSLGPKFDAVSATNTAVTVRPANWTVYDDVNRRTLSASGYATLNTSGTITGYTLTNPVSISIRNAAGNTTDQIQASRTTTAGKLAATDTFAQSSYITWTKNIYDSTGKQTATWQYISIPASGTGSSGTNYIVTPINSSEDVSGNPCRSVAPDGTITRTVYDWRNNPIQTWIGTNDTGATNTNPAGSGGSNNMVLIAEREYGMSGGCETCTGEKDKVRVEVLHPDDVNTRVTEYQYDWRGRQIRTINDRDQNNKITYSFTTYDNQNRAIKSEQFLMVENGTSSDSPLWGTNNPADDRLLSRAEQFYDERGRNWKSVQSIVNPTTGAVTGTIQSLNWYDAAGRVIKSQNTASPRYTKTMYDSLGNAFKSYVVTGTESGYSAATTLTNNTVLSQLETTYDLAGNAIMTASAERLWNQTGKGALTLTTGRFNYSAQWLDPAGRSFASADYGTNNGTALTRPATVPTSSATVRVSKTNYDANTGRVTSTIDPGGRTTQPVYDGMGRAYKTILPKPNSSSANPEYITEFDNLGRTIAQKDPLGNRTQTIYGNFGRVDATLDAKSNRTEYTYNRLGELISQKDPMGRVTQFVYDDLGRQIQTTLPKPTSTTANPVQQTKYNEHGLVYQEIDPLNHVTKMEYDGLGRMTAKVDALNGRTEYTYDSEGKMLTLKDPVGNITTYTYDDAGRVTQEKNALNKSRYFEYLAGGLVSKKTDRNGRIVTYTYDNFGNMTEEKWFSNTNVLQRTLAFTYDALGRMTQFTDPSGTHTMTYDDGDRNTQTVMQLPGMSSAVTLTNTFDLLNRRTKLATKIGTVNDFANTYSYDANSQVTSIIQQTQGGNTVNPKRIGYVYNVANQLTTKTAYAATGTTSKVADTTFGYDGMGRLNDLKHANGTKVFADYDFGWDAASRITDFDFTPFGASKKTADYAYDNTDQLTGAAYNSFQSNESYQYDANGNRRNTGYITGANNQLTNDGTFTYTYDNEGNRLTKKQTSNNATTTYTWDHRNRLTKVVTPSTTVEYAYDHMNRMTKRGTEIFIHNGYQIVLVLNASGTVQNRCFWGASQDELIAEEKSGTVSWTLCDHLSSVRDVVNNSGTSLNHLEYNAFGKLINQSSTSNVPTFRYTAKMSDDTTDLQWNINRWYDAEVGRWISEDPIGFRAGDANLTRYVRNNSLLFQDRIGYDIIISCNAEELFQTYLSNIDLTVEKIHYQQLYDDDRKFVRYSVEKNLKNEIWKIARTLDLIPEILSSMILSSRDFWFYDKDEKFVDFSIRAHLLSRIQIVKHAQNAQFGFNTEVKVNQKYWTNKGKMRHELNFGVVDALTDPWKNPSKYSMACWAGAKLVAMAGVAFAINELKEKNKDYANKLNTKLGIFRSENLFSLDVPKALTNKDVDDKMNDWVPGDWGYVKNNFPLNPDGLHPRGPLEGENIIYLGKELFWGHVGSDNTHSLQEWIDIVQGWDNIQPTVESNRTYPILGLSRAR